MKYLTNQDAYDATQRSINERWIPISNGKDPEKVPPCQLCRFAVKVAKERWKRQCVRLCTACPWYVVRGRDCLDDGESYDNWTYNKTKEDALAVIATLEEIKNALFGDWKWHQMK